MVSGTCGCPTCPVRKLVQMMEKMNLMSICCKLSILCFINGPPAFYHLIILLFFFQSSKVVSRAQDFLDVVKDERTGAHLLLPPYVHRFPRLLHRLRAPCVWVHGRWMCSLPLRGKTTTKIYEFVHAWICIRFPAGGGGAFLRLVCQESAFGAFLPLEAFTCPPGSGGPPQNENRDRPGPKRKINKKQSHFCFVF